MKRYYQDYAVFFTNGALANRFFIRRFESVRLLGKYSSGRGKPYHEIEANLTALNLYSDNCNMATIVETLFALLLLIIIKRLALLVHHFDFCICLPIMTYLRTKEPLDYLLAFVFHECFLFSNCRKYQWSLGMKF